jgi:two-component system response regulator AtoC
MMKNSRLPRVLVVEDELLIRWSIVEMLTGAGHEVIEACDGKAAVRAVMEAREPIEVVLLDYRLPDSNDFSLLSTIRALSPESSIILMTACGPEMTAGAVERGASRVLSKPFDMHEVGSIVVKASESRLAPISRSSPRVA